MKHRQRGAALLLAMMVVALVVTLAAGMVWLQSRAVAVEAAGRARLQGAWILWGALDWARLILREDLRTSRNGTAVDSLDEPWATPLAESRLSSFLAADQNNNADSGPEAFVSGGIADAQARFNLRSLLDPTSNRVVDVQRQALQRLADLAGAPADTAARIAAGLEQSLAAPGTEAAATAPLKPSRIDDLAWLGIDATTIARLSPWVTLLPNATAVNANTAPREVLMAAIDGLDAATAERLVQTRQRQPFLGLPDVQSLLAGEVRADAARVAVFSNWFEVTARLRLEDRVVEERALVQRDGNSVAVRRRERVSFTEAPR